MVQLRRSWEILSLDYPLFILDIQAVLLERGIPVYNRKPNCHSPDHVTFISLNSQHNNAHIIVGAALIKAGNEHAALLEKLNQGANTVPIRIMPSESTSKPRAYPPGSWLTCHFPPVAASAIVHPTVQGGQRFQGWGDRIPDPSCAAGSNPVR